MSASFALALKAAREAAGAQHYPEGALYIVATPIGNLSDLSLRALHVLGLADALACEDTRHTQALLRACGIEKPAGSFLSLHQHNEAEAGEHVIRRLAAGERVACVSDAGTPGVSDPGARLVAAVRAAGHRVVPLPGASSVTTLLSVAGAVGADSAFVFAGFAPARAGERAALVQSLAREPRAVVLLEAPHRISELGEALQVLGDRLVTLGRELTKQFEQVHTLACAGLPAWLAADPQHCRGEFALMLHPWAAAQPEETGEALLGLLLEELPLKTAVRIAAQASGAPRNALYEAALAMRAGRPGR